MHTQTIFELSQEAERLLQLALQNLSALKVAPLALQHEQNSALANPVASVHPLKFSPRGIELQKDMLQNERRKITQHEMVLAIVGTMKAGKSTTINAIVGTEVLPNRNRPMTALPTLIRHTPGQLEPVLHFPYVQPIENLMEELQEKLQTTNPEMLARKLEMDRDMEALIARIESGTHFERHYLGAQPIFHCLKSLNDLVRLCRVMDIAFPFKAYAAIEHVPVIEVEFVHLAGLKNGHGQLTLLDTPGPNEAGQPHLQMMLKEQLSQASAVLAVMDYTQLKSISDEEVREAVLGVSKSVPLYALVNKFDQKDRNGDDETQVKAMIAGTLMKNSITPDNVFPVSSMWGYLANRARYELATHGRLPDPEQQRWVQDFAQAALGIRWRSTDLADIEHLRHAADLLWEDSKFASPIEAILHAAHANASLYTLRAACHKLMDYAEGAERYLSFRSQGLLVTNDNLQKNILQLEQDIELLQASRQSVSSVVQQQVNDALAGISAFMRHFETQIHGDLSTYFREGRLGEEKLHPLYPYTLTRHADFAAGSDKLMGDDEATARTLLHKVRASSESILFAAQETLSEELGALLSNLEVGLGYTLQSALKPIQQRVSDGLKVAGFRAQISLPPFQANQLNFNIQLAFADVIENHEVPMVQMPPQNGMRSVLTRWLNSVDWGEDYAVTQNRYVIDLEKLHQKLHNHVSTFLAQINQAITAQVDISVTAGMATFFADFSRALDSIRSNLQQSLTAKQQNETVLFSLQSQLEQSVRTARYIHEDTRLLRDDIQTLFSAEQ